MAKTTIPSSTLHWTIGFPVYPGVQEQIGVWLITWHSAFGAHTPGQGSLHFWFKQAKWFGHSLLPTHSGWQFGGWPMKFGWQEQEGVSPLTWHIALGPHGEGTQGFSSCTTGGGAKTEKKIHRYFQSLLICRKKTQHWKTYELVDILRRHHQYSLAHMCKWDYDW